MNIAAFEGVVKQGQIQLKPGIQLPEKTRVYVLVPGFRIQQVAHIYSPRLVNPGHASDFNMEIVEDHSNASL